MNPYSYALENTKRHVDSESVISRPIPALSVGENAYIKHKEILINLIGHLLKKRKNVVELSFDSGNLSSSSLSISQPNFTDSSKPFGNIIQENLQDAHDKNHWCQAIHMEELNCKSHEIIFKVKKTNSSNPNSKSWSVKIHEADDLKLLIETWNNGLYRTTTTTQQQQDEKEQDLKQKGNLFCGFMGPDMFRADTDEGKIMQEKVVNEMNRIGNEVKEYLVWKKSNASAAAIDWDQVLQKQNTISGFGTNGIQLYVKCGFTITLLHDELLWSNAVNVMTSHSKGCSLWISFDAIDACQYFTIPQISEMMESHNVFTLVKALVNSGINLSYFYQTPGTMVESPVGNGSMHIVITHGDYIEQLAFNNLFSVEGGQRCLWFWKNQPIVEYNSARASRFVIPCLKMQSMGYDLGLQGDIEAIERDIIKYRNNNEETGNHANKKRKSYQIDLNTKGLKIQKPDKWFSCTSCLKVMDYITINDECVHCYSFQGDDK